MRIAYLINYCNTQLSFEESYLPPALAKLGHKVCIITSDRFFPFDHYEETLGGAIKNRFLTPGRSDFRGVELIRLPVIFEIKKRKQVFVRGIEEALRDFRPDVVHAFNPVTTMTLFAALLQKKSGYALVVDSHLERHNLGPLGLTKRTAYALVRHLFYGIFRKRFALFLAISEEARDLLGELFGIAAGNVRIKYLSVDTQRFAFSEQKRARARQELGISPQDLVLINAGKVTPEKKLEVIIKAALPVLRRHSRVKLLIVGGGPGEYMNMLKGLAGEFIGKKSIIFNEFVPNDVLPDYLSCADVGIWLKFSQIIMEAMAGSLPIIVSNEKSSSYLCENGNGFVVPADDTPALSLLLEEIAEGKHSLKDMGIKSRVLIEEKYSTRKSALRCQSFYEEAIRIKQSGKR